MGGSFEIRKCEIGPRRVDASHAVIAVRADTRELLDEILGDLVVHGATPVDPEDARLVAADLAGAFPEDFYSTTNQRTRVRLEGDWVEVDDQEMDCGVVVDPEAKTARCVAMIDVARGCWSWSATRGCRWCPRGALGT